MHWQFIEKTPAHGKFYRHLTRNVGMTVYQNIVKLWYFDGEPSYPFAAIHSFIRSRNQKTYQEK